MAGPKPLGRSGAKGRRRGAERRGPWRAEGAGSRCSALLSHLHCADQPSFAGGVCGLIKAEGAALASPRLRETADPQQTHVQAAPGSPAFSTAPATWEGDVKSRFLWISPAGCKGGETRALSRGGGAGTITNARASCAGCGVHRQPSGAALRNPAFVSAIGRERRWGRHLLEGKD